MRTERKAPFGRCLRDLREAAGLTQEELAAKAGLTAKAVSALERGERRRPYPHTVRSLGEALGITFEASDRPNAAHCLQGLAAVAGARGDPPRAVRLLGASEALLESAGVPRHAQVDREMHRRVADAARERLGGVAWSAAREEGRAMSFEEAVSYALEGEDQPSA